MPEKLLIIISDWDPEPSSATMYVALQVARRKAKEEGRRIAEETMAHVESRPLIEQFPPLTEDPDVIAHTFTVEEIHDRP